MNLSRMSLRSSLARAIAVIALQGAVVASPIAADLVCEGVDTQLTTARKTEYSKLVSEALEEDTKPSDIVIYNFMDVGSWSAVYASTPVSEDGVLFFETVGEHHEFRDVWGGWADSSERQELIAWAEGIGAPRELANCFTHAVIAE